MATAEHVQAEQRVTLHDIDWQTYLRLRDQPENYHVRMTYDRGELEMMSPSGLHEQLAYLIGRLIDVWTEECGIAVRGFRSVTFRRHDVEHALEPDNCYYVEHAPLIRDKVEVDLTVDPAPDLAIEIDLRTGEGISGGLSQFSSDENGTVPFPRAAVIDSPVLGGGGLHKLNLYAAFRVPEVWRYDGRTLEVYVLGADGRYQSVERSASLPRFPVAEVSRVLSQVGTDATALVRSFRHSVRLTVK